MVILVSDTSVLIDLERGELLEPGFGCGLTLAVPDLLYERELEPTNGKYLRALGLGVMALDPDEVSLAQVIHSASRGLSLADCFALCCALRPGHALLTGDSLLRKEAQARNAEVHGVLWLLDQMEASAEITNAHLHEGLTKISAHPKSRLPMHEVRLRLKRWGKS